MNHFVVHLKQNIGNQLYLNKKIKLNKTLNKKYYRNSVQYCHPKDFLKDENYLIIPYFELKSFSFHFLAPNLPSREMVKHHLSYGVHGCYGTCLCLPSPGTFISLLLNISH